LAIPRKDSTVSLLKGFDVPHAVCIENPNSDHSGDEVRPGWHVNE
jgi:hypothetical protein